MGRYVKTKVLPVPKRGAAIPDVRLSDHSPFWDQGYNALMVTDTSYMRNPHYHQMSDTVDTLDLPASDWSSSSTSAGISSRSN
jgi:hypothetical protein